MLELLNGAVLGALQREPLLFETEKLLGELQLFHVDFCDVRGQQTAKRALEVASAGSHNIVMIGVMIGPTGSGKSMLAKRLPSILARLPSMKHRRQLRFTRWLACSTVRDWSQERLFRSPHHSISDAGLISDGADQRWYRPAYRRSVAGAQRPLVFG